MFKRKKFMALCATTLAGLSVLGSFAPMAALADVAKAGDTVVTYEGAPKPAEWGLSVPATVKLDKEANDSMYGNAKVSIVDSDTATTFKGNEDKTFLVRLKSQYLNRGHMILRNAKDQKISAAMYTSRTPQSANEDEPTGWATPTDGGSTNRETSTEIAAPADGSVKASRWFQFIGEHVKKLTPAGDSMTDTLSWTAIEKTS
ncbi:hypothetical protein [Lactococcus lactis]|uniref:hypothetical protein n=1 Tax=Lactococcus lactis TaxID=1358 RepID=UPI001F5AFBE7|nr:hypothetical protein [Lactococcus lactis]